MLSRPFGKRYDGRIDTWCFEQHGLATLESREDCVVVPLPDRRVLRSLDGGDLLSQPGLHFRVSSQQEHAECKRVGRCIVSGKVNDKKVPRILVDRQTFLTILALLQGRLSNDFPRARQVPAQKRL